MDDLLGGFFFAGDALLLGPEVLQSHGIGVVGLLGFGALLGEFDEALFLALAFVLAQAADGFEIAHDGLAEFGDLGGGVLDVAPDVFDSGFDFGDQGVAEIAGGPLLLASEAVEIGIEAAVALALGNAETT